MLNRCLCNNTPMKRKTRGMGDGHRIVAVPLVRFKRRTIRPTSELVMHMASLGRVLNRLLAFIVLVDELFRIALETTAAVN